MALYRLPGWKLNCVQQLMAVSESHCKHTFLAQPAINASALIAGAAHRRGLQGHADIPGVLPDSAAVCQLQAVQHAGRALPASRGHPA